MLHQRSEHYISRVLLGSPCNPRCELPFRLGIQRPFGPVVNAVSLWPQDPISAGGEHSHFDSHEEVWGPWILSPCIEQEFYLLPFFLGLLFPRKWLKCKKHFSLLHYQPAFAVLTCPLAWPPMWQEDSSFLKVGLRHWRDDSPPGFGALTSGHICWPLSDPPSFQKLRQTKGNVLWPGVLVLTLEEQLHWLAVRGKLQASFLDLCCFLTSIQQGSSWVSKIDVWSIVLNTEKEPFVFIYFLHASPHPPPPIPYKLW